MTLSMSSLWLFMCEDKTDAYNEFRRDLRLAYDKQ